MYKFADIYRAGRTKRYHTRDTHNIQTVAEHSWGVAMILLHVFPQATPEMVLIALAHDLPEADTGDLPAPFKWANPAVVPHLEKAEASWFSKHGLSHSMSSLASDIIRYCDIAELVMFCLREIRSGNIDMIDILDRGVVVMNNLAKELKDTGNITEFTRFLNKEVEDEC